MSNYRTWEELSLAEQLAQTYSDFYKDVNGFRPRFHSVEQMNDAVWLQAQIDRLNVEVGAHQEELSKTFAGREQLRMEGWSVPAETDPTLAQYAAWLEAERERELGSLYDRIAA